MIAAITPVAALLLSVAILLAGNGLQGTLLPIRAQGEAFSAFDIGALGSSYFLGFGAGCFFGPYLVRRAGHIRTFAAMVALASAVVLVHVLIFLPFVWWMLRAITGFCFAVIYVVIESWLNEKSTNATRGAVFSAYTIINLTVITLGQVMLTLDSPESFTLFALSSILVSLAAVPVAFTKAQAPRPIEAVKLRLIRLYRLSPVGVVGCFSVGLANGAFWALAPIFAQQKMGGTTAVALFMSITVIAGAVGQLPLGRLSDKVDRRIVIAICCLGSAAAGIAMVLLSGLWEDGILAVTFAFGIFAFPLYAISVAHMNDFIDPEGYVEAASGLLLIYAFGAVGGPILASLVISRYGIDMLFAYTAAVHVLTAIFAFYRMSRRSRAPEEERVPFAEAIVVAQTVSTVDPTGGEEHGQHAAPQPKPSPRTLPDDTGR